MIEYSLVYDEKFKWSTHMVKVDGITIAGITDQTPLPAIHKFVALCQENEEELSKAVKAAEEKRNWNYAQPSGKGRMWPEFGRLEKLKNRLCKEAGIKDD